MPRCKYACRDYVYSSTYSSFSVLLASCWDQWCLCLLVHWQYLLANGEPGSCWPGLPGDTPLLQWIGLLGDLCMLWTHVLLHQGRSGRYGSCHTFWHDSRKAHGTTCLHWLCMLGTNRILWLNCSGVAPTDRCATHKDSPGILLPTQLMCQSIPVCPPDTAVPARSLHSTKSLRTVFSACCQVSLALWMFIDYIDINWWGFSNSFYLIWWLLSLTL
jgi:hypothetical protein